MHDTTDHDLMDDVRVAIATLTAPWTLDQLASAVGTDLERRATVRRAADRGWHRLPARSRPRGRRRRPDARTAPARSRAALPDPASAQRPRATTGAGGLVPSGDEEGVVGDGHPTVGAGAQVERAHDLAGAAIEGHAGCRRASTVSDEVVDHRRGAERIAGHVGGPTAPRRWRRRPPRPAPSSLPSSAPK